MGNPHVLAIPFPAQGHVIPLMELCHSLAKHGIKITFVNTDFNHERVLKALGNKDDADCPIRLVSIPDGMEAGEDRNNMGKLCDGIGRVMVIKLKDLINQINKLEDDDKITCDLADFNMGWAIEVATQLGIHGAVFCPASALVLHLFFCIKKMVDDQVLDEYGTPTNKEKMIQISPNTPAINPKNFLWICIGDFTTQKIVISYAERNNQGIANAEWLICNTTYNLEAEAISLVPRPLPIGPISSINQLGDNLAGNFWPEDSTCLKWLDQHPPGSVIYVAYGSFTILSSIQFQELALGLELTNMPFLWVVRPDLTEGTESDELYPDGFKDRVQNRGMMVGWAPQRAVLAHPSIACFLSHCGWNSTMEGVSNGLPFLCWPYFSDQFINQGYICEIWKIGLSFKIDERELITRKEIKNKLEQLLGDEKIKERAIKLKEVVMGSVEEGGSSDRILKNFIEWIHS